MILQYVLNNKGYTDGVNITMDYSIQFGALDLLLPAVRAISCRCLNRRQVNLCRKARDTLFRLSEWTAENPLHLLHRNGGISERQLGKGGKIFACRLAWYGICPVPLGGRLPQDLLPPTLKERRWSC